MKLSGTSNFIECCQHDRSSIILELGSIVTIVYISFSQCRLKSHMLNLSICSLNMEFLHKKKIVGSFLG